MYVTMHAEAAGRTSARAEIEIILAEIRRIQSSDDWYLLSDPGGTVWTVAKDCYMMGQKYILYWKRDWLRDDTIDKVIKDIRVKKLRYFNP